MIVGVTGKKQCGKNTFARFVRETAQADKVVVREFSCAAKLKDTAADIFGIERHLFDGTDEEKNSSTDLRWENVAPSLVETFGGAPEHEFITVRELMQIYGTEAIRGISPCAWANALRRELVAFEGLGLVTDVRFPQEAELIRDIGGLLVRVYRDIPPGASADHSSEKALDYLTDDVFDFVVSDEGNRTMDDLEAQARIFYVNQIREEPF
jgi:hypothetical protein